MSHHITVPLVLFAFLASLEEATAQDKPTDRRQAAIEFHLRATERTGLLIPMYIYPENIHTNPHYNRLIELKRQFPTIPFWVILNPASGPGAAVDANYTKAIDRLRGAGCVCLGYVRTDYAKRAQPDVKKDLDAWLKLYPAIQGAFFDEMIYEDNEAGVKHQVALNDYAKKIGLWPTVANPGAETPGRYFAADAANVIVIHEGNAWPKEDRLKGDYFGGASDYPPFTRAVLLHSQKSLDKVALKMTQKYARWVYVTEDPYKSGDPKADNPWDTLSKFLPEICEELRKE